MSPIPARILLKSPFTTLQSFAVRQTPQPLKSIIRKPSVAIRQHATVVKPSSGLIKHQWFTPPNRLITRGEYAFVTTVRTIAFVLGLAVAYPVLNFGAIFLLYRFFPDPIHEQMRGMSREDADALYWRERAVPMIPR